ncbi:hypothetical protein BDV59DRAFT_173522 [Aspergillus ambiguus]|uniref:uncharacterized protein n=1 Tax=Aspergillus ambiguus TaxID=176160 RepID=UPI003CCE1560
MTRNLHPTVPSESRDPLEYEKLRELNDTINDLLLNSRLFPALPIHQTESATALNIRAISRIKLFCAQIKIHQLHAFQEGPSLFQQGSPVTSDQSNPFSPIAVLGSDKMQEEPPPPIPLPSAVPHELPRFASIVESSTNICLRAALSISNIILNLPNLSSTYAPSYTSSHYPPGLGLDTSGALLLATPLVLPCLVESSRVMLKVGYKTHLTQRIPNGVQIYSSADKLVRELRKGLDYIVVSITNHVPAFEALKGARDEIQGVYNAAFGPNE